MPIRVLRGGAAPAPPKQSKPMSDNTKRWLKGVFNAAVSGAAATGGSFAAGVTVMQGAKIVGIAVVVSMIKWMVQHPLE